MIFPFDLDVVLALQKLVGSSALATSFAIFCARWALFLNIPLAVFLLVSKKGAVRHAVYEAFWAAGLGMLARTLISDVVQRPRPFAASSLVTLFIPRPSDLSFPSGHATVSISIALAFFIADKRIGLISFGIALLTVLGRVSVGAHYPTDILGGAIVACTAVYIVRRVHAGLRARTISKSAAQHHHEV